MNQDRRVTLRPYIAVGAFLAAFTAGGVAGADAPTKVRQDVMKTVGFSAKTAAGMVKGETPYDPVKAELAMRAVHAAAVAFPHLFPEDSKSGDDTEAAPKIWEDMKGFVHLAEELQEHAAEAAEAAKKGPDEFREEFVETTKYCKECHSSYRIKTE